MNDEAGSGDARDGTLNHLLLTSLSGFVSARATPYRVGRFLEGGILRLFVAAPDDAGGQNQVAAEVAD